MANGTLRNLEIVRGSDLPMIRPSDYVLSRSLASDTAESFTVPSGARFVMFAATGDFYVNYTTTATVPGDVTDGTASELNPAMRFINGVAAISVIAPANTVVTASFWTD